VPPQKKRPEGGGNPPVLYRDEGKRNSVFRANGLMREGGAGLDPSPQKKSRHILKQYAKKKHESEGYFFVWKGPRLSEINAQGYKKKGAVLSLGDQLFPKKQKR